MRPAAPGSRAACTVSSICNASDLVSRAFCGGAHTDSQAVISLRKQRGVDVQPWRTPDDGWQKLSRSTPLQRGQR